MSAAWKVAYADFVTAMFALFMVLWIMNQDEEVVGSVSAYFNNPWQSITKKSTKVVKLRDADVVHSREALFDSSSLIPKNEVRSIDKEAAKTFMENEQIRENRNVHVEETEEGVIISFFTDPENEVFEAESASFTEYGKLAFEAVGWVLARYAPTANDIGTMIEITGHTQKGFSSAKMGPWKMSSAQANAARKELMQHGVSSVQIVKIAGVGDIRPLLRNGQPISALSRENRRVDILVRTEPPD